MMIYRAGHKTPPGFSLKADKGMNKSVTVKIILTAVVGAAMTLSSAHANAIAGGSPSTNGFSTQNGGSSLGPQLSLNGGSSFITAPIFSGPVGTGGFTPVSGGPGPVTTQPVIPSAPVAAPDSGSTLALLALAVGGLILVRRKTIRA
jgi:hypothetical protein